MEPPSSVPPIYEADRDAELPTYSHTRPEQRPARTFTEHVYHLLNGKNRPWATFKLQSAARSPESIPVFLEGDMITGKFELDVDREHIVEIAIVAMGRIVTSIDDYDSHIFLNLSHIIWSRAMGDPGSSTSSVTTAPHTEKLNGNYSWPFAFMLSRDVTLMSNSPGAPSQTSHFPPTFLEKNTRVSIQYDISALIRRGKFRSDWKLGTVIAYVPCIKPEPPSPLRQLAYQEGSPILGPDIDPDGWKSLEPVYINGMIFNDRSVQAKCTLSLAKPLCYTRGTAIPCVMTIETPDEQALDLLSSPRAIVVRLQRCVAYTAGEASHHNSRAGVRWEEAIDYPASSVWWPKPDGNGQRSLDGEIQLSRHLKPSSAIMHFSITYNVMIFPFEAIAFHSADKEPLLTQKVEIGTLYARGPRARTYSPPTYSDASSKGSHFIAGAQGDWV